MVTWSESDGAHDLGPADGELLVGAVDGRRCWPGWCAGRRCRRGRPWPPPAWPSGWRRTGRGRCCRGWPGGRPCPPGAICEGPSSPMEQPDVGADQVDAGPADGGHAHEVVGPGEEGAEGGGVGHPAPHLDADGVGHHLLLGDEALDVAVGVGLAEDLGEGGVGHLAVEGDHVAPGVAQGGQGLAVDLAGGDGAAQLVGGELELAAGLEDVGVAVGAAGLGTVAVMPRSPPSSSMAPSMSSRGLPWALSWSSTAFTPLPFLVRARITVGLPVTATASAKAASMASTSWPSTSMACQPKASNCCL